MTICLSHAARLPKPTAVSSLCVPGVRATAGTETVSIRDGACDGHDHHCDDSDGDSHSDERHLWIHLSGTRASAGSQRRT